MVSCLACLTVLPGWGQLIGSRGVISLRPGQLYRDRLTVEASQVAARLALLLDREERRAGRHQAFRWRTSSDFKYPQRPPSNLPCFVLQDSLQRGPASLPDSVGRDCWSWASSGGQRDIRPLRQSLCPASSRPAVQQAAGGGGGGASHQSHQDFPRAGASPRHSPGANTASKQTG